MIQRTLDPELINFCRTETQKKRISACIEHGSPTKAARVLGVDESAMRRFVRELQGYAALKGFSPEHDMTHPTAPTHLVKGVSTLYGEDGQIKQQWVKTQLAESEKFEAFKEACEVLASEYHGIAEAVPEPRHTNDDLMTVYPFGDPHIGMYSWHLETGDDFDCDIAKRNLCRVMTELVRKSPASGVAILLNLGDFFHADNNSNQTMRSHHALDVDSRWARVLEIGIQAMRACINSALKKHGKVIVQNNIGNHDDHSSVMLAKVLAAYYHKDKRVTVGDSISKFWYYRHGKVLIGSTHGDTASKPQHVAALMACDRAEDWGKTTHRHIHMGHVHNKQIWELPGCTVESHRTLAARDSWAHAAGYRSARDMQAIVYHKEKGEVERYRVGV